jgi:uncharacterized protein YdhG (YjbR/CyaY superfamily)
MFGRGPTILCVSSAEIDNYLAEIEEPKRSTLQRLRQTILEVVPEAEEGISYGLPAFRLGGKVIAGFAAFKNHLSYLPHSGSVFPVLTDQLDSYKFSSGALQFPIDASLPKALVENLVRVRIAQALPDEQERTALLPGDQGRSEPCVEER